MYREDEHPAFVAWFVDPTNGNANDLRHSLQTVPGGGRDDPWVPLEGDLLQTIGDARNAAALPVRPRDPGAPIQWTPVNAETFRQDDLIDLKERLVREEGDRRRQTP